MVSDIATTEIGTSVAITNRLDDYARQARGAFSDNTVRAIGADTAVFSSWCAGQGLAALPAPPERWRPSLMWWPRAGSRQTVRRYVASTAHDRPRPPHSVSWRSSASWPPLMTG